MTYIAKGCLSRWSCLGYLCDEERFPCLYTQLRRKARGNAACMHRDDVPWSFCIQTADESGYSCVVLARGGGVMYVY